ncbi:acyl CoA--acetate/3-ketoacid CoA transferase subunit alpha [Myxococcota bacterium]|nr:acyl CoA--acetate/3-ketoacid CoA transferase subunit alpha [Myxococcota bacterium]
MDKRTSIGEVVAEIRDGMTLGIGGWGARRKPMALIRELLRSPVKDLTVVSYGGPDVGMLCATGKVRKLVFGFVSLDLIPLEAHFRAARQRGEFEVMEIDEGMLQWGLRAAAMRMPFLPTRVGLATDVQRSNPEIKTIQSPYEDGETLLAMPALELDVALCHVNQADERGNCQILGPDPFFDDLFCRAAKQAFVSCERVVPTETLTSEGCIHSIHMDRSLVDGIVEAPFGAHPTSCAPDYGIDVEHLREYSASAKGSWDEYCAKYITAGDDAGYLDANGGTERISGIEPPIF